MCWLSQYRFDAYAYTKYKYTFIYTAYNKTTCIIHTLVVSHLKSVRNSPLICHFDICRSLSLSLFFLVSLKIYSILWEHLPLICKNKKRLFKIIIYFKNVAPKESRCHLLFKFLLHRNEMKLPSPTALYICVTSNSLSFSLSSL